MLIINKIPFSFAVNATVKGSLNCFAFKWYKFSDERKQSWINNFKPTYHKELQKRLTSGKYIL
jgi:hypothetical protein